MIGFLIFYFAFSAIFAIGVLAYDKDDIPLDECVIGILLGWLFLPFGLDMLVSHLIKSKKNEWIILVNSTRIYPKLSSYCNVC